MAYRIGGIEREENATGKAYSFELELPTEPGTYKLEVEAVFKDGSRDKRTVVVDIKGRCKKPRIKYEVNRGEAVRNITAALVRDARDLLQFLGRRGVAFKLSISATQAAGGVKLKIEAHFTQEAGDKAQRLLAALETISPSADATFEFKPPITA